MTEHEQRAMVQAEVARRPTVIRIFVSHPIGAPDDGLPDRLATAHAAGAALLAAGLAPYVPGWPAACYGPGTASYESWMQHGFAWLDVCDALVRLPGVSPGADREVARARERGLPVYFDVEAAIGAMAAVFVAVQAEANRTAARASAPESDRLLCAIFKRPGTRARYEAYRYLLSRGLIAEEE